MDVRSSDGCTARLFVGRASPLAKVVRGRTTYEETPSGSARNPGVAGVLPTGRLEQQQRILPARGKREGSRPLVRESPRLCPRTGADVDPSGLNGAGSGDSVHVDGDSSRAAQVYENCVALDGAHRHGLNLTGDDRRIGDEFPPLQGIEDLAQHAQMRGPGRMERKLPILKRLDLIAAEVPDIGVAVGVIAARQIGPVRLLADRQGVDRELVLVAVLVRPFAQAGGLGRESACSPPRSGRESICSQLQVWIMLKSSHGAAWNHCDDELPPGQ